MDNIQNAENGKKFNDFFERLIAQIEHVIRKYSLNDLTEENQFTFENGEWQQVTETIDCIDNVSFIFKYYALVRRHCISLTTPSNSATSLGKYFGLNRFALLSPAPSSILIDKESLVSTILSAIQIALINTGCQVPIFTQSMRTHRLMFSGVYEDKDLRTQYQMVHFDYVPLQFSSLDGLVKVFKSKMRNQSADSTEVSISIKLSYLIYRNKLTDKSTGTLVNGDKLPFGSVRDSIDSISLSCSLRDLSEERARDLNDSRPEKCSDWSLLVALVETDSKLTLLLSQFLDQLNQLDTDHLNPVSKQSNIFDKVRLKISNIMDFELPSCKLKLDHLMDYLFTDANLTNQTTETDFESVFASSLVKKLELIKASASNANGLLNRLGECMAILIQKDRLDAATQLWQEFISELRFRFENRIYINDLDQVEPSKSDRTSSMPRCLLHQKVQMINYCIQKRVEREHEQLTNITNKPSEDELLDCNEESSNAEGRLKPLNDFSLILRPHQPLYVPVTQDLPPLTDDMLDPHESMLSSSTNGVPLLTGKNPSRLLLSNMQHATKKRIFDEIEEAEKIFDWLNCLSVCQVIEHMMPIIFHSAIHKCMKESTKMEMNEITEPLFDVIVDKMIKTTQLSSDTLKQTDFFFYRDLVLHVEKIERLVSLMTSLHSKFFSNTSLIHDDQVADIKSFLKETVKKTSPQLVAEIKIENGANGVIGRLLTNMCSPVPNESSSQSGVDLSNKSNHRKPTCFSPIGLPFERQYTFCLNTLQPTSSRQGPQQMHALLKNNEFRLAGAFSQDTTLKKEITCQLKTFAKMPNLKNMFTSEGMFNQPKDKLNSCKLSISPEGSVMAIANKKQVLIYTHTNGEFIPYSRVEFEKPEKEYTTALICIPTASQLTSNEDVIAEVFVFVGTNLGNIRIYSKDGVLLMKQMFHQKKVTKFKCRTYESSTRCIGLISQPEEVEIFYETNVLVCIDGVDLFHYLKAAKNCTATANEKTDIFEFISSFSLKYKKWKFEGQDVIDFIKLGLGSDNLFDQMTHAAMDCEANKKFNAIPPSHNRYLTIGKSTLLSLYYAPEVMSEPVMTDVDVLAEKMVNLMSSTKNFLGIRKCSNTLSPQIEHKESMILLPVLSIGKCCQGVSLIISPANNIAAITDNFGRIFLFDTQKEIVLRMFTDYHDAQIGWISSQCEENENPHHALFLVIYAPRRGLLEVWDYQQTIRIASFDVGQDCKLIYFCYFMLSLDGCVNIDKAKSSRQIQCLLLTPEGLLKTIQTRISNRV